MLFREDEVMLIQGWKTPSAVRKDEMLWGPFIPEFRLVAPCRRLIESITSLRDLHGKVSAEFQKLEALRKTHGPLPMPPLPGIKDRIIALRSQAELVAEGREQKNCVASYTDSVTAGSCYI